MALWDLAHTRSQICPFLKNRCKPHWHQNEKNHKTRFRFAAKIKLSRKLWLYGIVFNLGRLRLWVLINDPLGTGERVMWVTALSEKYSTKSGFIFFLRMMYPTIIHKYSKKNQRYYARNIMHTCLKISDKKVNTIDTDIIIDFFQKFGIWAQISIFGHFGPKTVNFA